MDAPNARPLPAGLHTEVLTTSFFDPAARQVEAVNVCHLIDVVFPEHWDLSRPRNYEVDHGRILAWCADHGFHYYARPRESFDLCEAAEEAAARGLCRVVYEDLS